MTKKLKVKSKAKSQKRVAAFFLLPNTPSNGYRAEDYGDYHSVWDWDDDDRGGYGLGAYVRVVTAPRGMDLSNALDWAGTQIRKGESVMNTHYVA